MAHLHHMDETLKKHLETLPCPTFENAPWVAGPPLDKRRVAIVSTAGIHGRDDRPFTFDPGDCYRVIPGDIQAGDLVMSHVSTNFDHTGFQQDWNIVFPIDRLRELAGEGIIGSVADFHYSFMGANDPMPLEQEARSVAGLLKKDAVDAVLLVPV
ncbi:MAG: selenoprotein B glycine/betaine/sarcosine/D-proline reductase [Deltaproteobacteria bacterium]|nr:selenoprotein B glycine/betaine/sarcosine/D-proline reductase [Deltaproteobacteria bacterium]